MYLKEVENNFELSEAFDIWKNSILFAKEDYLYFYDLIEQRAYTNCLELYLPNPSHITVHPELPLVCIQYGNVFEIHNFETNLLLKESEAVAWETDNYSNFNPGNGTFGKMKTENEIAFSEYSYDFQCNEINTFRVDSKIFQWGFSDSGRYFYCIEEKGPYNQVFQIYRYPNFQLLFEIGSDFFSNIQICDKNKTAYWISHSAIGLDPAFNFYSFKSKILSCHCFKNKYDTFESMAVNTKLNLVSLAENNHEKNLNEINTYRIDHVYTLESSFSKIKNEQFNSSYSKKSKYIKNSEYYICNVFNKDFPCLFKVVKN